MSLACLLLLLLLHLMIAQLFAEAAATVAAASDLENPHTFDTYAAYGRARHSAREKRRWMLGESSSACSVFRLP